MITVIVNREGPDIKTLFVEGHAGYSEDGNDIVCAGISTLFYTAAHALTDICGYDDEEFFRIVEKDGDVNGRIALPDHGDEAAKARAQVILRTIELGIINIAATVNKDGKQYVEVIHSRPQD